MSDWTGVDDMFEFLAKMEVAADVVTKTLVASASLDLVREAQSNFAGQHPPGEPHVGGNLPNIVSGDLRRSIRADIITRYGRADYGTTVAPRMIYGRRVELGFQGSAAYPYFGPAARALHPKFERDARDLWVKAVSLI